MQSHEWLWIAGGELVGCTCLIRYAQLYVLPIIMHSTTLALSRPASRLVTTTLPAHDHIQLQPCCSWSIGDHFHFWCSICSVVSIALAVYKTVVLSPCRLYSKDSALYAWTHMHVVLQLRTGGRLKPPAPSNYQSGPLASSPGPPEVKSGGDEASGPLQSCICQRSSHSQ